MLPIKMHVGSKAMRTDIFLNLFEGDRFISLVVAHPTDGLGCIPPRITPLGPHGLAVVLLIMCWAGPKRDVSPML